MLECFVIGPGASHHPDKAVRIFVDQIQIAGDLAPPVFDRGQIFDPVVLNRLEQALEPFASGRMIGRRSMRIGINSASVRATAIPSAPEEVSIS